jgi:hypothetical protein
MPLEHEHFVELLYRQGPIQRFTQDSPVLPDVWVEFAEHPGRATDLLLTPFQPTAQTTLMPGELSRELSRRLGIKRRLSSDASGEGGRQLAYNESIVAVRLTFEELIRYVIPLTKWWIRYVAKTDLAEMFRNLHLPAQANQLADALARPALRSQAWDTGAATRPSSDAPVEIGPDVLWFVRVVGTIALLRSGGESAYPPPKVEQREERIAYFRRLVAGVAELFAGVVPYEADRPLVYLINVNRKASVSMWKSGLAIKADAARQLFNLKCGHLAWAIIDSGIDATHPSFRVRDKKGAPLSLPANGKWQDLSRVIGTYDFTIIRALLSDEASDVGRVPRQVKQLVRDSSGLRLRLSHTIDRIRNGLDVDWGLVLPLIEIPHTTAKYKVPEFAHGTHVAGILGSCWTRDDGSGLPDDLVGICPDIRLYDFRVLGENGEGDEFDVIAALQAVRYLNAQASRMTIQGVNISLAIPHQVMNYACGRTPVCEECDRLWQSGVTVVAAAGNRGYDQTQRDAAQAYRAISITDPGNGERLITVGATHRDMPHTYGVSFFSSRGPTGDGRVKPDIVAPGEKINSCVPGEAIRRLDGTSMAAPHVSGAAALLMARHEELVGQPDRIKQILCRTATDLGREHYFQGHGMLDVLRALQDV